MEEIVAARLERAGILKDAARPEYWVVLREYDLSNARWRKSSYSNGEGGSCIEVADGVTGVVTGIVPVRDSKIGSQSPTLLLGAPAWHAFVAGVREQRNRFPRARP
ncbi:DUF397 domain-containing protein [Streptomyces sp. NPDC058308]|uniref:DUF397 domain-containing protein n=1 Tax=Streptomyces sp. NPDC058308 TaxID=3346440 RepID=UPI0036E1B4FB